MKAAILALFLLFLAWYAFAEEAPCVYSTGKKYTCELSERLRSAAIRACQAFDGLNSLLIGRFPVNHAICRDGSVVDIDDQTYPEVVFFNIVMQRT